jgi:hypothetical protein
MRIRVGNRMKGDFAHADARARLPTLRGMLLGYAASTRLKPFHSAVAAPDISTGM